MTEKLELYKCETCGNIAEIVIEGEGSLSCCGAEMKKLTENTSDGTKEYHIPSVEHLGSSHVVKIGQFPHPMKPEHYIQFIEAVENNKRCIKRKYLNPDEEPEMVIKCLEEDNFKALGYCNIHGLYSNEGGKDGQ